MSQPTARNRNRGKRGLAGGGEGDRRGGLEKAGWLVAELAGVTQGRLRDQRSLLFSSIFFGCKEKKETLWNRRVCESRVAWLLRPTAILPERWHQFRKFCTGALVATKHTKFSFGAKTRDHFVGQ